MSPFLILIAILLLVLVGLLFIPIDIYINTSRNQYYAELKGLAKASIEGDKKELVRIKLRIPFKSFYFYPLRVRQASKKIEKKKKAKNKKTIKNRFTPKTVFGLLKSFTVKRWNVDLDTGNCITNAKLYTLFTLLNYHFGGFLINFEGRNHVFLWLRNRPIYIIKSFINP